MSYTLVALFFTIKLSPSICLLKGLAMEIDDEIAADDNDKEVLQEIVNNTKLSEGYLTLARDIEVMEPKSPEDIYKVMYIFIILLLTIFVIAQLKFL
jgi:26S proteasome regulatory subunit N1